MTKGRKLSHLLYKIVRCHTPVELSRDFTKVDDVQDADIADAVANLLHTKLNDSERRELEELRDEVRRLREQLRQRDE